LVRIIRLGTSADEQRVHIHVGRSDSVSVMCCVRCVWLMRGYCTAECGAQFFHTNEVGVCMGGRWYSAGAGGRRRHTRHGGETMEIAFILEESGFLGGNGYTIMWVGWGWVRVR
jgi:hypothetical protein